MGAASVWGLSPPCVLNTRPLCECFVPLESLVRTLDICGDHHLERKVSSPFFFPTPSLLALYLQLNSLVAQVSTYRLVLGIEQEIAVFSQISTPPPPPPQVGIRAT